MNAVWKFRAVVNYAAVFVLLVLSQGALAQFTKIPISIPGLRYGSAAWGDYDKDGYLDLLVTGDTGTGVVTRVYHNLAGSGFVDIGAGLPGVSSGMAAWGDFNGDGYLDIALTGMSSTGRVSSIFRNNGDGTFTDIHAGLTGLDSATLAWGDFDNDGDLDLFLTGYTGSAYFARIFRNDGNGVFTDTGITNIVGGAAGSAAWADFDQDGDLDLLFAGFTSDTSSGQSSRLYRNNNGSFTNITSISLTAMSYSSVAWGDYDNDGHPDMLMAGSSIAGVQSFPTLKLYHNNVTSFTSVSTAMTGLQNCSVAWGDYDNDGNLDVAVAGYNTSFAPSAKIYRNNGAGSFVDIGASISGLIDAVVAWGDYDNDGDLDLLVMGFDGTTNVTRLYRNDAAFSNIVPSPPGPSAFVSGKSVTFTWSPGSDGNQPAGFSYNLRVGTSPGADDLMPSMSDPATGFRRVVKLGNVGENSSWTLRMPVGTYYWSAQTIDHSFAGSPFAFEQSFNVPPQAAEVTTFAATNINIDNATLTGSANANGDSTLVYFEYGPDTSYGSATTPKDIGNGVTNVNFNAVIAGLQPAATYHFRAVAANNYGITYGNNASFTTPLFTEMAFDFLGVGASSVAWGDYDNDGFLDLLVAGSTATTYTTRIYRNLGGTNFVDIQAGLPGINFGQAFWGDFDNDGKLDVLITGNGISKIFHNDGNGVFTEINANLPGLSTGASGAWADFNNDGTLDFAIVGAGGLPVKTYRNDGGGQFTDLTNTLPRLSDSSIAWADYDNDGDMDLLITGYNYGAGGLFEMTRLYKNDGRGNFTNSNLSFQGVSKGSVAWGDYNNDGNLDFLVAGGNGGNRYSMIYSNTGAGTFVLRTVSAWPKMDQSCVAWADYDNDGDLDFVAMGTTTTGAVVKVFRNDGGSTLFRDSGAILPRLSGGSVAWGDFDNDGRLDLIMTGYTGSNYITKIYRNNALVTNTPPSAPDTLNAVVVANSVTLNWGTATDINQPGSLSYNLRVGTAPGLGDTMGPMADLASGFRRVPRLGNTGLRRSWTLTNLVVGTYYWSVQAIDHNYAGSPFSTNGSFTISAALLPPVVITKPATNLNLAGATLQGTANAKGAATTAYFQYGLTTNLGSTTTPVAIGTAITNTALAATLSSINDGTTYYFRAGASNINGQSFGATLSFLSAFQFSNVVTTLPALGQGGSGWPGYVAWGDFDNDGDLDVAVTAPGLANTYLYRNDGGGGFTLVNTNLPSALYGTLEWGDYNHDGWLDLLIAGSALVVARNNGDGTFTTVANITDGLFGAAFATWVDYDNDGDLDICCYDQVESNAGAAQARLYRNDKGVFVPSGVELPQLTAGWMAWGDYDGDGWPDLAITGQVIITNYIHDLTLIYRNDGNGNFTNINAALTGLEYGRVLWCDVDNDGDLDLIVNGGTPSAPTTLVYRNDNGVFTNAGANLPGSVGPMVLTDYDGDGRPDLVLQNSGPTYTTNRIYRNNGNGTFSDSGKFFLGAVAQVAWADFDNDGDLDVLIGPQLYRNNNLLSNTPPSVPTGLTSTRSGNLMTLQWNPSTDLNQAAGLTYNLQVGTSPGNYNVVSGEAAANGFRRVVRPGIISRPLWKLALPVGTYYWRVQAIDHSLAGSAFSAENSFTIPALPPFAITDLGTNNDGHPVLNGRVNPNGLSTVAYFQYGITNFEFHTPVQNFSNTAWITLSNLLTGLQPERTYSYRLFASNSLGTNVGITRAFFQPWFTDRGYATPGGDSWADFDGDGDLDVLVLNQYSSVLWRNDNGVLTNIAYLTSGVQGSAAWCDYDNDGDLDVLVTGLDGNFFRQTRLYRNDGNGVFTQISAPLTGVYKSAVAWADLDGDGKPDLIISGADSYDHPVTQVLHNEGNDVFVPLTHPFPNVASGAIACADYDNDGYVDVIICGDTGSGRTCRLFRNLGNLNFVDSGINFPGVQYGSLAWGDYDGDGRMDLLLTGGDNTTNCVAALYHNIGTSLVDGNVNLPGLFGGAAWTDFDNDGRLDIVMKGSTNGQYAGLTTLIFRNLGSGVFSNANLTLPAPYDSTTTLLCADFDNDGDVDLGLGTQHYLRNESIVPNLLASAPSALVSTVASNAVILRWNQATDANQPNGLSYNVRVGTSPGAGNILSGMAAPGSGRRLLPEWGNAFGRTNFILRQLNVGTYYWSAQAVDYTRAASLFVSGGSFVIPTQAPSIVPLSFSNLIGNGVTLNGRVNPNGAATTVRYQFGMTTNYGSATSPQSIGNGTSQVLVIAALSGLNYTTTYHYRLWASNSFGITFGPDQTFTTPQFVQVDIGLPAAPGAFAVGDYDNDGYLDFLMATDSSGPTKLFHNNGIGGFTDTGLAFPSMNGASIDWGDFDNDGNLDALMAGFNFAGIYRNLGNGVFTNISSGLPTVWGSMRWGDYDNDGLPDVLVSTGGSTQVYRNQGGGHFVLAATVSAIGGYAVWGDYDNDGDLDIAISGVDANGNPAARIIRNDGPAGFTDSGIVLSNLFGKVAWGDYDNDGDLDLLLSGSINNYVNSPGHTKLYRNDGGGICTEVPAALPDVDGNVIWADYDNDGRLDIVITGLINWPRFAAVFHNNGNGTFTDIRAGFTPVSGDGLVCADLDRDGDLDLLISGYTDPNFAYMARLYRNYNNVSNTPPSAPASLSASVSGSGVTLSWLPAADANQSGGLTYNLRIGSAPGLSDIVNPMANIATGQRKVSAMGNMQQSLHWSMTNLPAGTYYWSVQAIDNSFAGSAFAPEMSFVRGSAPQANPQLLVLSEDTSQPITLTGSDPDGRPLTFSILTAPAHGVLSGSAPNLLYRPVTNYFGGDAFTFRVNNGVSNSAPAQISLAVIQVPDVAGATLSLVKAGNQIRLTITGEPYDRYLIEASQDLIHWTVLTNVVPTNGPLPFLDSDAALYPRRFYRAVLQLNAPEISAARLMPNGSFQFNFTADVGRYYQFMASTNLRDWTVLTNLAAPASNVIFFDSSAPAYPRRFYQVRPMP
jgi:hypothetical protein